MMRAAAVKRARETAKGRLLIVCCSLLLTSAHAHAQAAPPQGFRLGRHAAPPTANDGFALVLPEVLGHLQPSAQLMGRYELSPLVVQAPGERTLVEHRTSVDAVFALGLFDLLELYARLPVLLSSSGEDGVFQLVRYDAPSGPALSDMAFGFSALAFARRGVSLGGRAELIVPSGARDALTSDGVVEPRFDALAAYERGRVLAFANLGGIVRPDLDYANVHIGSELTWGVGLRAMLDHGLVALLEAVGTRVLRSRDALSASDGLELSLGGRHVHSMGEVTVSVGGALSAGLSDLAGEPAFRALGQVAVQSRSRAARSEQSAEPDNDGDGLPDLRDACPVAAEDRDGYADDDGCPDSDDDADRVADALDACPRVAGASKTGCPTDDLDDDGVRDALDRCPRDPEDLDADRDEDGCPDKDSDGDGLTDDQDGCPDVAGLLAQQGCLAHARLVRDRIELTPLLSFDAAQVALTPESREVLDDVAALLVARPHVRAEVRVRLTQRPGLADHGRDTATVRTALVLEALVARGVGRARLSNTMLLDDAVEGVEIWVRAEPSGR